MCEGDNTQTHHNSSRASVTHTTPYLDSSSPSQIPSLLNIYTTAKLNQQHYPKRQCAAPRTPVMAAAPSPTALLRSAALCAALLMGATLLTARPAHAFHAWGGRHWASTGPSLTVIVVDCLAADAYKVCDR